MYQWSIFSSCLHFPPPEQFDLLSLISQSSRTRLGILCCRCFRFDNRYLLPDKGHDSDPRENVLTRQPLTWDSVSKGLCSICPRLTQVSHEQRHIGPDENKKHLTAHVTRMIPLWLPGLTSYSNTIF